jgi:hypothetical protein
MKNNKIILGVSALALTALVAAPSIVSAYKGDPNVQGPNYSPERHAVMTQAFANNDYNAWKEQVQGRGVANKINESNFAQFAQAHQLAAEGKTEEAAAIRAELGLGLRNGSGQGSKDGNGQGQKGQNAGNRINQ